jgi:hypothetical protein
MRDKKLITAQYVSSSPIKRGRLGGGIWASIACQNTIYNCDAMVSMVTSNSPLAQATPPLPLLLRREVMRVFLLITISLITSYCSFAQTPYTGGIGDGHAMGELQLRSVAVSELSTADGYQIYPSLTKAGEAIYITSPVAGALQIIDIIGRIIYTQTIEQPVQQLPVVVTQAGLCIGIIRTQAGTFTQKIIVVE